MSSEITTKIYGDAKKAAMNATVQNNLSIGIAVASQAKALAPVDMGQLRNSIMWKTLQAKGGNDGAEGLKSQPASNEVYVGSAVEHAVYQEFGTRYIPGQPYLRPAIIVINNILAGPARRQTVESIIKEINKVPTVQTIRSQR